ncbi:MAG: Hsp20/alpha crystallin family protein, partial [candidate division WOR-3 bacterium]|nr:Hsp20/alpha crystallin family protein [candidate division WOR-3 bacterium]
DFFGSRLPGSLFDNYFSEDTWAPLIDIEENKDEFVITAELPGMKKDDIDISIDNNTLVISGEKEAKEEKKEKTYHRIERSYGKFYRAVSVPRHIDPEKIKAGFEDGVLEVKLPKSEKAKSKKIEIK